LKHCKEDEYCDGLHRCKEVQEVGTCCEASKQCAEGLKCQNGLCAKETSKDGCIDPVADCPADGSYYCSADAQGGKATCKKYQDVGGQCGGNTPPLTDLLCDPSVARCVTPSLCYKEDAEGYCVAIGSVCSSSDDCNSDVYCDNGACMPKLPEGGCCNEDTDCEDGLECQGAFFAYNGELVCFPSDLFIHIPPYALLGENCNDVVPCFDPTATCVTPFSCYSPKKPGNCALKGNDCSTIDDCEENMYCLAGKTCMPLIPELGCCESSEECQPGYECLVVPGKYDNHKVCTLSK
jgi:hypothetical protein